MHESPLIQYLQAARSSQWLCSSGSALQALSASEGNLENRNRHALDAEAGALSEALPWKRASRRRRSRKRSGDGKDDNTGPGTDGGGPVDASIDAAESSASWEGADESRGGAWGRSITGGHLPEQLRRQTASLLKQADPIREVVKNLLAVPEIEDFLQRIRTSGNSITASGRPAVSSFLRTSAGCTCAGTLKPI